MAFDAFTLENAVAKCAQQDLLFVLLDYNVFVGPRIAVSDRLAPRVLGLSES